MEAGWRGRRAGGWCGGVEGLGSAGRRARKVVSAW